MARASGSGPTYESRTCPSAHVASGSSLPHGSTSGMLVQHVRSPAHVTLSEPRAHGTTAARLRPPQDSPSVVLPAVENASVRCPPVVYTSASFPPAGFSAARSTAPRGTSVKATSVKDTSVFSTSADYRARSGQRRDNHGRDYHGREKHGRDTAENFSREIFPREKYGRDTAENFSREAALRPIRDGTSVSGKDCAEEEILVVFSDSDQEVTTLSPPLLSRADQAAPESFRPDLSDVDQEQEDRTPSSEAEILRKSLLSVAELCPSLVRRVETLPKAGFCEVAAEEELCFAPHPNVETWMNQQWNGLRNMQSLRSRPWTPEYCPVSEWPQPAGSLPAPKEFRPLAVDSPAAPPPSGPSASEEQSLIKPEKLALFNKRFRTSQKVEGHMHTAMSALAATSTLASAMSRALRDPENPSRLSSTPDPDDILAIMDALPVTLCHLSKGLTAARISAAVASRDEFLSLSEVPKAMAEKLRMVPLCKGSMFGPYLKAAQEVAPTRPPASAEDIGLAMARALQSGQQKQKHWGGSRSQQPRPRGRGKPSRSRSQPQRGRGRGQPKRQNPPPPPPQGN